VDVKRYVAVVIALLSLALLMVGILVLAHALGTAGWTPAAVIRPTPLATHLVVRAP
jgi:hypothetical protein